MNRLWTTTSAGRPDRTRRHQRSPIRPEFSSRMPHFTIGPTPPCSDAARRRAAHRRDARWFEAARSEGASPPATSLPSRPVPAGQRVPVASKIARLRQSVRLSAWQPEKPRSCGTCPAPGTTAVVTHGSSLSQGSRMTSARSSGATCTRPPRKQRWRRPGAPPPPPVCEHMRVLQERGTSAADRFHRILDRASSNRYVIQRFRWRGVCITQQVVRRARVADRRSLALRPTFRGHLGEISP
jgi:hypothetical protein